MRQAVDQGIATIVERNNTIAGYSAGIGLSGHAVAKSNEDMKTLIANASAIVGLVSLHLLETVNC